MTTPGPWVSRPDVLAHVGDGVPADVLEPYVDAAVDVVAQLRPDLEEIKNDPAGVGADVRLAVAILAKRLYSRRDAALGIATFGEFGPIHVARADNDVARLLRLGVYSVPVL